jgi:hypothetical protein
MNIIAPVFAPQFRQPMPADLQDIIREKMMATLPPRPKHHKGYDKGLKRRQELTPQAVSLRSMGMPLNEIAAILKCSKTQLDRIMADYRASMEDKGEALSFSLRSNPCSCDGVTYPSMAKAATAFGVHKSTIKRYIDDHGSLEGFSRRATA